MRHAALTCLSRECSQYTTYVSCPIYYSPSTPSPTVLRPCLPSCSHLSRCGPCSAPPHAATHALASRRTEPHTLYPFLFHRSISLLLLRPSSLEQCPPAPHRHLRFRLCSPHTRASLPLPLAPQRGRPQLTPTAFRPRPPFLLQLRGSRPHGRARIPPLPTYTHAQTPSAHDCCVLFRCASATSSPRAVLSTAPALLRASLVISVCCIALLCSLPLLRAYLVLRTAILPSPRPPLTNHWTRHTTSSRSVLLFLVPSPIADPQTHRHPLLPAGPCCSPPLPPPTLRRRARGSLRTAPALAHCLPPPLPFPFPFPPLARYTHAA